MYLCTIDPYNIIGMCVLLILTASTIHFIVYYKADIQNIHTMGT